MNAITPIISAQDAHKKNAAVLWNQQRGKLIDLFTKSEFAVTETLQLLSSIEERGGGLKIHQNLQGRFTQLLKLFASAGPFAAEGKAIVAPLAAIGGLIDLRNMLCHGRSTMYFDDKGRWIVQLEMQTVVKGCAEQRDLLLTQDNVRLTLKDLTSQSSIAVSRLAQLRKNLTAARKVTPSAPQAQASR